MVGGKGPDGGLGFDRPPPPGGYLWWYLDAVSPDGDWGLSVIAFIGSVFSPYYAWSGRTRPQNHCAVNVGIYRRRGGLWAMTERPARAVTASADRLDIGPSTLHYDGRKLVIEIDEVAAPLPRRVRGRITADCAPPAWAPVPLSPTGGHIWQPLAPSTQIDVALEAPALAWSGHGYVDSNRGDEALEDGVRTWTWARLPITEAAGGKGPPPVAVLYDLERRDGTRLDFGHLYHAGGAMERFDLPPVRPLARSAWRMQRSIASDGPAEVIKTAEDSPFYTRSITRSHLFGAARLGMHESLNMDRFSSRWMKALMPVRMPRQFW